MIIGDVERAVGRSAEVVDPTPVRPVPRRELLLRRGALDERIRLRVPRGVVADGGAEDLDQARAVAGSRADRACGADETERRTVQLVGQVVVAVRPAHARAPVPAESSGAGTSSV